MRREKMKTSKKDRKVKCERKNEEEEMEYKTGDSRSSDETG